MLVQKEDWRNGNPFSYAIVLKVNSHDDNMEADNEFVVGGIPMEWDSLVGTVELCLLNQVDPRSRKFVAMTDGKYSCSSHKLIKHVVKFNVTKRLCGQSIE